MTGPEPPEPDDDLYATLGLLDDSSAADITHAYRRLARQHHPDANPDAEADRFAGLTDAYDILRDPDRRSAYDRTRRSRTDAALPPGTPHGRTLRARGRGIPAATGAGDLLVTVHVDIPAELNDEQRAALEVYAAATASPRAHLESPGS